MTIATTTKPTANDLKESTQQNRYELNVEQYTQFKRDGYLVVRNLVPHEDVAELRQHTDDLLQGRLPEQQDMQEFTGDDKPDDIDRDSNKNGVQTGRKLVKPPEHLSPQEKAQYFLRIHMLHRKLALHEKYMLHPRVLDVLEVLTGPDILALQTMLFLKPPGKPGQGWHQDSYYIPTHPDSLCAAWIAIDDCDERNGAMWFARSSGNEPVYPPCPNESTGTPVYGFGDTLLKDTRYVQGVSNTDDSVNDLAQIADRYDQNLITAKAGDVVFFNGHVLHRSKQNWSEYLFRRAFVGHYCNARSFTQWGADLPEGVSYGRNYKGNIDPAYREKIDPDTKMTNGSHILARGDTHLPFAQPKFGTHCAALEPAEQRKKKTEKAARIIANRNNGLMGCAIADTPEHDEDD